MASGVRDILAWVLHWWSSEEVIGGYVGGELSIACQVGGTLRIIEQVDGEISIEAQTDGEVVIPQ